MKSEELSKDQIKEIMKNRGYELTASGMSGGEEITYNFIKMIKSLNAGLHAKVMLKSVQIQLTFVQLQYFCTINTGNFDFLHPDFEKIEKVLNIYAAKCIDVHPFDVLAEYNAKLYIEKKKEDKEIKGLKSIDERKTEFWDKIRLIGKEKKYDKRICVEFYEYWTQMNDGGKLMQWEITKNKKGVFDIGKRLVTWLGKDRDWKDAKKTFIEKKIELQEDAIKQAGKVINHKDLF